MRVRLIAPVTAALVAGTIALTAAPSQAAPAAPTAPTAVAPAAATAVAIPTQTIPGVGTVDVSFTPTRFAGRGGQLTVSGLLNGTFTDTSGSVTTFVNQATVAPAAVTASCTILDLTLGPLHLNLLGLVVDLNAVHLTITAQQGPGNLLGNLLCAVANLLNGGTTAGDLAALLNQILALLGGL